MYSKAQNAKNNNMSQAAANSVFRKNKGVKKDSEFVDNRPEAAAQKTLMQMINNSPRVTAPQRQGQGQRGTNLACPPFRLGRNVQRMKIREVDKNSEVSGPTAAKHVVGIDEQADKAEENYLHSTFVTSNDVLTTAVDNNDHNFVEANGVASARYDFDANVKIYLWKKTEGPGVGKPVEKTIDGVETLCEIGVKKGGDEKIKITHFKAK